MALTTAILLSLVMAGAAAATPVRSLHDEVAAGTVHYFDPEFAQDAAFERTDTVSFEPGRIEPGEPVTIRVHQTDRIFNTNPPDDCAAGPIGDTGTQPHTEWFLDRVDPGKTIYSSLPVSNIVHGSGTLRFKQDQFVCYLEEQHILELTIPGEHTALLTTGCYQTSGYNPQLVVEAEATGTIATLVVGDVPCTDAGLTLTGAYSYSGFVQGNLVHMQGVDTVSVTGSAAALQQVVETCITSTWSAYAQGTGDRSTMRMLWNGQHEPFNFASLPIDFRLDQTFRVVGKPPNQLKILEIHGEIIRYRRCDPGTGRSYPALPWGPDSGLQVVNETAFQRIEHSLTVSVRLSDGRFISVAVPGSDASRVVNWEETNQTDIHVATSGS